MKIHELSNWPHLFHNVLYRTKLTIDRDLKDGAHLIGNLKSKDPSIFIASGKQEQDFRLRTDIASGIQYSEDQREQLTDVIALYREIASSQISEDIATHIMTAEPPNDRLGAFGFANRP